MNRALGAAIGLLADRLLGEPRVEPHPVALLGSTLVRVEARMWARSRARGLAHTAIGMAIGVGAGALVRSTALSTYVSTSGRMLGDAALDIRAALGADDLDRARQLLPMLVGRDPSALDGDEIARAVVESVAENTVD